MSTLDLLASSSSKESLSTDFTFPLSPSSTAHNDEDINSIDPNIEITRLEKEEDKPCEDSITNRRRKLLPGRTVKDNFLHGCKRRVISKPKKIQQHLEFQSPEDLVEFYTQRKDKNLNKFKTSNLETIFEEPIPSKDGIKYMGGRKMKRCVNILNSSKPNAAIIKKRRLLIKKAFGRSFRLKKVTLEEVIQRLDYTENEESNGLPNTTTNKSEIDSL